MTEAMKDANQEAARWRRRAGRAGKIVSGILLAGFLVSCGSQESGTGDAAPAAQALPEIKGTRAKAEAGDPAAQNDLGEIYAEGKQVRQDFREASQWYRKAAEQGFAKAQYNLGVLYDIGQGVTKDEVEAAQWYRKAAEQGNTDAQYTLAGMYGLGRGMPRDPKEALRWYERAAEQGDALSCYNLAERYERGRDVAQDLAEAFKWHSLAAERGLKDAAAARNSLKGKLTSEQLAEARKRLADFHAKHPSR